MFLDPRFWLSVSFLIFLGLLFKYIFPKILNLLDIKSKQISDQIQSAKSLKEEAENLLISAQDYHQQSLLYCENLINEAKLEAEKILQSSKKQLEQELEKQTNIVKEKITQAESKAIREIKEKIISDSIDQIEAKSMILDHSISKRIVEEAISIIGNS